jgi:hypothetical protein
MTHTGETGLLPSAAGAARSGPSPNRQFLGVGVAAVRLSAGAAAVAESVIDGAVR